MYLFVYLFCSLYKDTVSLYSVKWLDGSENELGRKQYARISLQDLRKVTRNLGLVCSFAEIWNGSLPNTFQTVIKDNNKQLSKTTLY